MKGNMETENTDSLIWDQSEYEAYLQSPEYKRALRKRLGENHRKMKVIKQENMDMFKAMADPDKSNKMHKLVSTAHLGTLNYSGEDVVDAIKVSIENCDDLDFFLKHRNDKFYKSTEVLDEHMEHPVQKKLIKEKHLTRREMKKQKSAFNHLKCLFKAKLDSKIADDVKDLQKEVEVLRTQQSVMEAKNKVVINAINSVTNDVNDVKLKVEELGANLTDTRKVQLLMLRKSGKSYSVTELSKLLGVTRATVYKWDKEVSTML